MRRAKTVLIVFTFVGVWAWIALRIAYAWAFSGTFDCLELGCGILAELVLWPLITLGGALVAGLIGWKRRRAGRA